MQYDFPAVFYSDENAIAFHFYDREDWFSFGDNVDEAISAAEEILNDGLLELERENKEIPTSTPLDKVEVKPLQLVKMIHADTEKYARELTEANNRKAIQKAENPIKELRERQGLSIKELSDLLNAPYRTVQDWNAGKSKPPEWVMALILDRVLND